MSDSNTTLEIIWNNLTPILSRAFGKIEYESYIESNIKLENIEKNALVFSCQEKLVLSLLKTEEETNKFKKCVLEATGTDYDVVFVLKEDYDKAQSSNKQIQIQEYIPHKKNIFDQYLVNPNDTFDTFVVGDSNKQAYTAAKFIVQTKDRVLNPLFIYADSGLGKTHLLCAIYNLMKQEHPDKIVRYVGINDFIELYVRYIRDEKYKNSENKVSDIKDYFNNVDCVLFDDIQFLTGKKKTQEVFFDIFNKLLLKGSQVVVTSDCPPEHISDLDSRLISRFSSGLSCSIKVPEKQTMINILKKKIQLNGLDIDMFDDQVLSYIASKFSQNVRQIEGALNRVLFFITMYKDVKRIDMNFVRQAFEDKTVSKKEISKDHVITIDDVVSEVSNYLSINIALLKSKVRLAQVVYARKIAMYLSRKLINAPYNEIGRVLNKDHSTVLTSCNEIEENVKTDKDLEKTINTLIKNLS